LRFLAAIELLTAAQAVDVRGLAPDAMGQGPESAYAVVRERVAVLDEDRPLGPDIEAIEAAINGGRLATIDLLAR